MKQLFIILLLLFLPFILIAQKVKIVRVIEPTLFELNTEEVVRLANIKLPDSLTTDPGLQALRRFSMHFLKNSYHRRWFNIHYSNKSDASGYPLVHLTEKFPLNTFYLNRLLLEKGYGRYVNNADSLFQKKYRQAAFSAKKYKRGLWNPNKYLLSGLGLYSIQLLGGYLEPDHWEKHTVLNDYILRFGPAEQQSGIEVSGYLNTERKTGRFCCDCYYPDDYVIPSRTETFFSYGFSIKGHIIEKYGGMSIGMTYLNQEDKYCSESFDSILFPQLGFKLGWMQKVYLSLNLADIDRLSVLTIGINYIFKNPLNCTWIGYDTYDNDTHMRYGFETQFNPWKNFLVMVQGGRFDDQYQTRYGGRIGLGWVLR